MNLTNFYFCIVGFVIALSLTSCIGSWHEEKYCKHIVRSLECDTDAKQSVYRNTTDLVIVKKRVRNFDPFGIRTTLGPISKFNEEFYIAKQEDVNYVINNTSGDLEEIYILKKHAFVNFLDLSIRLIQDTYFWTNQGTSIYVVLDMKLRLIINGQIETIYPMLIIERKNSIAEYMKIMPKGHYSIEIPYFKNYNTKKRFIHRFSHEHFYELIRKRDWYFYHIETD